MRLLIPFVLLFLLAPAVRPAPTADESKDIARIEKTGATVTVDDSMPEAARLRVSFAKLDDKSAAALRGCKRIAALIVEDATAATDRTLAVIGTLTSLRELSLFKPNMTNAGMSHLKALKELRKLYLIDAKVYDSGVAALKGHEKLEELDLSGTMVTSAAGATFKSMTGLKLLAVSKTRFGDAGATQLKVLPELQKLEAVAAEVTEKGARGLEDAIKGVRVRR